MQDYLKTMGIDRWTLRQNAATVLPACYAYELSHQGQCVGMLFAAASSEDSATAMFLNKMIAAIKCEPRGGWYFTQPDYSEYADLKFVVTLGDGFEVPDGVRHIHSYSPQQLLSTPKLKAETWRSLQVVFKYL